MAWRLSNDGALELFDERELLERSRSAAFVRCEN